MDFNTLKTLLIRELIGNHGCHTVILYGSMARGDATECSDVDVLGIRETGLVRGKGACYAAIHAASTRQFSCKPSALDILMRFVRLGLPLPEIIP